MLCSPWLVVARELITIRLERHNLCELRLFLEPISGLPSDKGIMACVIKQLIMFTVANLSA
jgi:hypothetical protein